MAGNFFKNKEIKNKIKVSAEFIFIELDTSINETVEHFEKEMKFKNDDQKESFKFEVFMFVLWWFNQASPFEEVHRKLLLDEIHNTFYDGLRKMGQATEQLQQVADLLNKKYTIYGDALHSGEDGLMKVGLRFSEQVAEVMGKEPSIAYTMMPIFIMKNLEPKFLEWGEKMK